MLLKLIDLNYYFLLLAQLELLVTHSPRTDYLLYHSRYRSYAHFVCFNDASINVLGKHFNKSGSPAVGCYHSNYAFTSVNSFTSLLSTVAGLVTSRPGGVCQLLVTCSGSNSSSGVISQTLISSLSSLASSLDRTIRSFTHSMMPRPRSI